MDKERQPGTGSGHSLAGTLHAVATIIIASIVLLPEVPAQNRMPADWIIDYEKSHIRFTAEQVGADFEGEWKQWQATLRFDPVSPDTGSFDVSIEVAGVDTQDRERDENLMEPAFFDGVNFPLVHYRASEFLTTKDGFVARGLLEVKGAVTPVDLHFSVEYDEGRILLVGTATLDRLALEVGTGEWSDTAWIGQYVDVAVHIEARL